MWVGFSFVIDSDAGLLLAVRGLTRSDGSIVLGPFSPCRYGLTG